MEAHEASVVLLEPHLFGVNTKLGVAVKELRVPVVLLCRHLLTLDLDLSRWGLEEGDVAASFGRGASLEEIRAALVKAAQEGKT